MIDAWRVIVGPSLVYEGHCQQAAEQKYKYYKKLSRLSYGPYSGDDVILMHDDECVDQHSNIREDECDEEASIESQ